MTEPPDPYWDELGIAWKAVNPPMDVIVPRLRSRIRRQGLFITISLILGLPLGLSSFVLGVYSVWIAFTTGAWNFFTRGLALLAIGAIITLAMRAAMHVKSSGETTALPEMLDLAMARLDKTLFAIKLGFWSCGVAALVGLVGAAIRTRLSRPPALSPLVDLAVLAIIGLGLFEYSSRLRSELAKYKYLRRTLALEDEPR
jgi:hypothetical protein